MWCNFNSIYVYLYSKFVQKIISSEVFDSHYNLFTHKLLNWIYFTISFAQAWNLFHSAKGDLFNENCFHEICVSIWKLKLWDGSVWELRHIWGEGGNKIDDRKGAVHRRCLQGCLRAVQNDVYGVESKNFVILRFMYKIS